MSSPARTEDTRCWCGNADPAEFSATYARCSRCGTLVSRCGLKADEAEVRDDSRDFYGKAYWLSHQSDVLGLPDIYERARLDLPERCLHWLSTLLGYALPPAQVLELGSGHGAFVALMRWAGFDAAGLEVSPWVVDFSRTTFEIPVFLGAIEAQSVRDASLDVVVLNDVLEHLVDPLESMRRCAALLRPGGFVLVQTPRYPDPETYEQLAESGHPFLAMLQEREHLNLFSERAVRRLFAEVGLGAVRFEPALFPYDMFFLASREELTQTKPADREEALLRSPDSRLVRALLDLDDRARSRAARAQEVEKDRRERIGTIERQSQHIEQLSADYEARRQVILEQQATIERLGQHIEQLSVDYDARLRVILEQQVTIERLSEHLGGLGPDHEARLKVILEQQTMIERLESEGLRASVDLEAHRRVMEEQARAVAGLAEQVARLGADVESQFRAVAQQQATFEGLIDQERQRATELEARLGDVEGRQRAVDALAHTGLVRLLRALKLL